MPLLKSASFCLQVMTSEAGHLGKKRVAVPGTQRHSRRPVAAEILSPRSRDNPGSSPCPRQGQDLGTSAKCQEVHDTRGCGFLRDVKTCWKGLLILLWLVVAAGSGYAPSGQQHRVTHNREQWVCSASS